MEGVNTQDSKCAAHLSGAGEESVPGLRTLSLLMTAVQD